MVAHPLQQTGKIRPAGSGRGSLGAVPARNPLYIVGKERQFNISCWN
jgi:hypothetical protein